MNLDELQPAEVLKFFREICAIPHASYHVEQISDYLVRFATKRHLKVRQDEKKNVIIFAPATEGYENEPPIAIQGHMDMVAVKEKDCTLDLSKDGLDLQYEDGFLYAKGTSLGGDDGIAIAYALAIMDSDSIPHPEIEAIFTVDEEVGMDGAMEIDLSDIRSKRLLNIDSEVEGVLTVSCAGGMHIHATIPASYEPVNAPVYQLTLTGLKGGHSGVEIDKGRGNAAHLLARSLYELNKEVPLQIVSMESGTKDNAIPSCAMAEFILSDSGSGISSDKKANAVLSKINDAVNREFSGIEDGIELKLESKELFVTEGDSHNALTHAESERILSALISYPDGVVSMCGEIEGLVETSLNLGILKLSGRGMELDFSLRSSIHDSKMHLRDRVVEITKAFGGTTTENGEYPSWEYRKDSPFRELMVELFEEQYGKKPEVVGIHAGLECGILIEKKPDLECVSMGPNLLEIHTTREKMDIESVERTWKYIKNILAKKTL